MLCQSGSPKAREIVTRVARGEAQPDLQRRAIQASGCLRRPGEPPGAADIYAATSDASVKKSVLQAFMVSGEKDRVLEAARSEKDPALRAPGHAAAGCDGRAPGALGDVPVGDRPRGQEGGASVVGRRRGARTALVEVARSDKDPEMRLAAMRSLGPFGGPSKAAAIVEIYKAESDPPGEGGRAQRTLRVEQRTALIDIAKSEKDPQLKKKAVSHLANMHSKEATAFLLEILNK